MKIAVVGTGAIGSVYAGLLGGAGNEVWAVDVWRDHINAIRDKGLRVEGASGDRVVRISATTNVSEVDTVDLVIIATKAMYVEAAAESAQPLLGSHTTVLTIQNGLGSAARVARILGTERVVLGVAGGFGASIRGPGHVHHSGWERVGLGELERPVTPRLERIAEVWRDAGFTVQTYDDINQLVWGKLICNVCYSGVCMVLECTMGEVIDDVSAWQVASGCAREAHAVACARGINLEIHDPVEYVRKFGAKIRGARPSTLLDFLAGRKSEIEFINGAIPPAARKVNLAAPYNEAVTALARAKETRLRRSPIED